MSDCLWSIHRYWGKTLRPCTSEEIAAWNFDAETKEFLLTVGLPAYISDKANLELKCFLPREFFQLVIGEDSGTVFGKTDTDALLLIESSTGHIYVKDTSGKTFVNGNLKAFLCCVAMYSDFPALAPEDEGEPDDEELPGTPVTRERAALLRKKLNMIDPLALDDACHEEDVSYWGFIVEEIEYGVI